MASAEGNELPIDDLPGLISRVDPAASRAPRIEAQAGGPSVGPGGTPVAVPVGSLVPALDGFGHEDSRYSPEDTVVASAEEVADELTQWLSERRRLRRATPAWGAMVVGLGLGLAVASRSVSLGLLTLLSLGVMAPGAVELMYLFSRPVFLRALAERTGWQPQQLRLAAVAFDRKAGRLERADPLDDEEREAKLLRHVTRVLQRSGAPDSSPQLGSGRAHSAEAGPASAAEGGETALVAASRFGARANFDRRRGPPRTRVASRRLRRRGRR